MKLRDFFDSLIDQGIQKDPRGVDAIKELLQERKEKFEKLPADEKEEFDIETLSNPYADSRLLHGNGDEEIVSILAGIDMETPELLLANTLKSMGKRIDAVMTHHPEGRAYATFYRVMELQADVLNKFGIPINVAESLTDTRMKEVGRRVSGQNHTRAVDAAKLLGIPFFSAHTVADNQVTEHLQELFDTKRPKNLGKIVALLKEIPEYKDATATGVGPTILIGSKESRAGKIFVDMTGGTEGAKEAIEKLVNAGVGTLVGMHMSEDHYKKAQEHHLNVVIAGHISSDNLGMNLILDAIEKKHGRLEVIECSGFRRFKRS